MEKTNEAPDWAKELISTVEELKQRVDTTYPEAEKSKKPDFSLLRGRWCQPTYPEAEKSKKPDFSAFVERLKFTGKIPDK